MTNPICPLETARNHGWLGRCRAMVCTSRKPRRLIIITKAGWIHSRGQRRSPHSGGRLCLPGSDSAGRDACRYPSSKYALITKARTDLLALRAARSTDWVPPGAIHSQPTLHTWKAQTKPTCFRVTGLSSATASRIAWRPNGCIVAWRAIASRVAWSELPGDAGKFQKGSHRSSGIATNWLPPPTSAADCMRHWGVLIFLWSFVHRRRRNRAG